jgi:hypothetical protein
MQTLHSFPKLTRDILVALQFMHRVVVGILQENFEWIPHAAANVLDRVASMAAGRAHEEVFMRRRRAAKVVASPPRCAGAAHGTHFIAAVGLHLENEAHLPDDAVFERNACGLHLAADIAPHPPFIHTLKNFNFQNFGLHLENIPKSI